VYKVKTYAPGRPTRYYSNGIPKHRSESAKQQYLKQYGLKKVPPGYEIDHRIPLSAGGSDSPSNMQLLTKSQHHLKTKQDAKTYGWYKKPKKTRSAGGNWP
jgi:5-methylcytosine-specific restriction endonuclease McrA